MWKETDRTLREIESSTSGDAQSFLDFGLRLQRFAGLVRPYLLTAAAERSELLAAFEAAGEQDLFDEFALLSVRDLLDRYFESEHLKSLLDLLRHGLDLGGPSTPGTSYVYGHHSWGEFNGEFGQFGLARGGMGGITEALAARRRHHGARSALDRRSPRWSSSGGVATGVALESTATSHHARTR